MTMADTIAVMNQGVIEQLGAPAELYENPRTTFVANFLGQSNLVRARVADRSGDTVVVDCHGQRAGVHLARSHADSGEGWLGVRPEKIFARPRGSSELADLAERGNLLTGGRITDVSFVGVSTQYLVRMPWDQELMVFEQNTGQRAPLKNDDEVDLVWAPEHSFLLDATQDAEAGVMRPEDKE